MMRTVIINDAFIKAEERIAARMIREDCRAGREPDFRRIERRAYAEAIDRALKRGT
jgi:hypothetical protein